MNSNRVLVTGANGRLGQAVLRMLGHNAIPAMRRPIAAKDGLLIEADGSVEREALRGFSAIINCAGRTQGASADINQANVTYPLGLAQIARSAGVRRFVQVSSFSVFGRAECIDTITPIAPRTAYGRSKVAAEHALRTLVADDFEVVSLRLPFMFSAQHPALLGRLISILLRSRVLPTQSGSSSRRSMITYSGAADALIALATAPKVPGDTFAAADPTPLDLTTVVQAIREQLNKRIMVLPFPRIATAFAELIAPTMADRLFRSSVLSSAANMLTDTTAHSVKSELIDYLAILGTHPLAGHGSPSC